MYYSCVVRPFRGTVRGDGWHRLVVQGCEASLENEGWLCGGSFGCINYVLTDDHDCVGLRGICSFLKVKALLWTTVRDWLLKRRAVDLSWFSS